MAYIDFPDTQQGRKERKAFWTSREGVEIIAQWRREGMSLERISHDMIGIADTTLMHWRGQCGELEQALRASMDSVNASVERSLLQRALGYDEEEVVEEMVEGRLVVTRRTTKHVPPDVKACLSWLYSRRSDRWRAQQEPLDTIREDIDRIGNVLVSIVDASQEALPEAEVEFVEDVAEVACAQEI